MRISLCLVYECSVCCKAFALWREKSVIKTHWTGPLWPAFSLFIAMIAPSLFAIFWVASVVSIKNSRFLLRSFYVGVLFCLACFSGKCCCCVLNWGVDSLVLASLDVWLEGSVELSCFDRFHLFEKLLTVCSCFWVFVSLFVDPSQNSQWVAHNKRCIVQSLILPTTWAYLVPFAFEPTENHFLELYSFQNLSGLLHSLLQSFLPSLQLL